MLSGCPDLASDQIADGGLTLAFPSVVSAVPAAIVR